MAPTFVAAHTALLQGGRVALTASLSTTVQQATQADRISQRTRSISPTQVISNVNLCDMEVTYE
jgi:hypothetical protein